jgi:hypothetical protein
VFFISAVAPALLLALGLAVALDWFSAAPPLARLLAFGLAALGGILLAVLLWYARQPRLAYDGRHLLVYLRPTAPIAVPIDAVECFFLGSGLRELPGHAGREVEVAQISVRLAERATQFADADVKPALGKWCGGYITIYGAWCEPLSIELVHRLNSRLAEAHTAMRDRVSAEPAIR